MPKWAALSGRRHAQHMISTFEVHQISVNEIKLIHPKGRVVGTMSPISYLFVPAKNIESLNPKCKQGGQLVEHVLGANSKLQQFVAFLAKWKHS